MMRVKKTSIMIILLFFLICGVRSVCAAEDTDAIADMFFAANNYYNQEQYEKAIAEYSRIIEYGYHSGALYFNLGNAYYRIGAIGKALVNYERAKKYLPQDEDLEANEAFLHTLLIEKQPDDAIAWYVRCFYLMRDSMPADTWVYVSLGVYACVLVLLLLCIFFQPFHLRAVGIISMGCGILVLTSLFTYAKIREDTHSRHCLVVAPEAEVRYSPAFNGAVAFRIHEGLSVHLLREENGWAYVRLAQGKTGWMEIDSIEEI